MDKKKDTLQNDKASLNVNVIVFLSPLAADTPLDCEVSVWSPWGLCKGKCGDSGVQHRTRYVVMHSANSGLACPLLEEDRKCIPDNCL